MIFIVVALLLATLLYWLNLIRKNEASWIIKITQGLTIGSNLYLAGFLIYRWIRVGYFPLSNLYESLVFLTWCLTAVQIIAEVKTSSRIIGAILTPIEFLVITFATFLPKAMQAPEKLVPALQSNWLMFHVSMMIISYATLILGSLLSVLLVVLILRTDKQEVINSNLSCDKKLDFQFHASHISLNDERRRRIRNYSFRGLLLTTLDLWSYRSIGFGHIALTLGILAGAVWANESWGSYWSWDPKETWSLITWLIFTAYLHARLINNWKGLETALIGSIGFFSIWVSYLGVNFLASGLHSYGWIK